MTPHFLRLPSGAAVFDPERITETELRRLLALAPDERGTKLPGAAGRCGVRLIDNKGGRAVWRHNTRGGWRRRVSNDTYFWLGEKRTRTFREWHLLAQMHREGLPVPAPIAAFYRRRGFFYSCDLITSYLPGTSSLGSRILTGSVAECVWDKVTECIRRFQAQGYCHADLNAHNIMIDEADRVYLLDFDRGTRRAPGSWVESNWRRLRRSVKKLSRPDDNIRLPEILIEPARAPQ